MTSFEFSVMKGRLLPLLFKLLLSRLLKLLAEPSMTSMLAGSMNRIESYSYRAAALLLAASCSMVVLVFMLELNTPRFVLSSEACSTIGFSLMFWYEFCYCSFLICLVSAFFVFRIFKTFWSLWGAWLQFVENWLTSLEAASAPLYNLTMRIFFCPLLLLMVGFSVLATGVNAFRAVLSLDWICGCAVLKSFCWLKVYDPKLSTDEFFYDILKAAV